MGGDVPARGAMMRVYAAMFCLFEAWHWRHPHDSAIFSAAALLALVQGTLLLAAASVAAWLGLWCGIDKTADIALRYQVVFSISPTLVLANWLVLRLPERQEHLRSIGGAPPFWLAKIALVVVVAVVVLALFLYRGWLPGVPDSLELITRCHPVGFK